MPQSLAKIYIHLVFSTKGRHPWLTKGIRHELHPYLGGILRERGCPPVQIGGVDDHVHILTSLSRTITVAKLIEEVKTGSSKWLKTKGVHAFVWQNGYGALSVDSGNYGGMIRYIAEQEIHHGKLTFEDEYRELMRMAGVEIDERYVWD